MNISTKQPAYALATVLILLGITLFGVGSIITVSTLESKISRSQQEGIRAYYATEAGVEDALWRVNNNTTYHDALVAGTLNVTYTSSGSSPLVIYRTTADKPASGEGFTVTLLSTAANYATLTTTGYSDNGTFKSQRQVVTNVFIGPAAGPTEGNVMVSGGTLDINNGSNTVTVTGGDLYGAGSSTTPGVSITKAGVNIGTHYFNSPNTYTATNATVTSGGQHASNYQPAADPITIPGIDFTYYSTHNNASYTATGFQDAIKNGGSTVNFPGPVTYVSGSVNLGNSWAKNKTVNITGMLVINGSLSTSGSVKGLVINVSDPGTGKSGIFLQSNLNNAGGTWNVNGTLYSSGSMTFTKTEAMTISGGIVAADTISLNTGASFNLTYNNTRMAAVFGAGAPAPVEVKHWEEEY